MDGDRLLADACRGIVVALWRQVARDVGSRSPARRAEGVAFLMSEQATVWAQRYDPDCDADIVIRAILVATRHVKHTRHTAARDSLDAL
jgi:hypothetical protein